MTAPARNEPRLTEQAEKLLEGWPAPSKSALEWEDLANATVSRARDIAPESGIGALLDPPLPAGAEEGSLDAPPVSDPGEDEPKLADIARAVVAAGAAPSLAEVAREGLLAAEHVRPPAAPAAKPGTGPALRVMEASRHALPSAQVDAVQAFQESATARSELPRTVPTSKSGSGGFVWGGAALAAAAAIALFIGLHERNEAPVLSATSHEAAATERAPRAATAEAPRAAPAAPGTVTAIEDLPQSQATRLEPAPASAPASRKAAPAPANATPPSLQFRLRGPAHDQEKLVLEDQDSPEPETAAAPAQQAVVPPGPTKKDESLPTEPSLGAVQGAIGAVMMGARSCLAGQDTGSKATIVFGSDGRAKSVTVGAPAAGGPAETCVRSALMAARVPPFSEPTFSASLTVRPP